MHKKNADLNNNLNSKGVPTQIKNPELVRKRRRQIVDAAVDLFVEHGYHKTTTRMIARAVGFSIGSLYEYVSSKEDILYLVCEAIHSEAEKEIKDALAGTGNSKETLREMIRGYFRVCCHMSEHILLLYKTTQYLPSHWKEQILEKELQIINLFVCALQRSSDDGNFPGLDLRAASLVGHNIAVLGQMWAFRKWYLAKQFTIDEFIENQSLFVMKLMF
ncbi:MAG: TetR/AcrR family transcriptional regulator [Desulfobacterium sp.]